MRKVILGLLMGAAMLGGCASSSEQSKDDAEAVAAEFANHFFNWHYEEALALCTPESEKWIRLLASNVSEEDVEALRESDEANVQIDYVDMADMTDTAAVATVTVRGFLMPDSIGGRARRVEEGQLHLWLVRRDGAWLVRMEDLPQNEMSGLD